MKTYFGKQSALRQKKDCLRTYLSGLAGAFPLLAILLLLAGCASPASGNGRAGTPDAVEHSEGSGTEAGTDAAAETSAEFDTFLKNLFCSEVSSNTINLHFTLAEPESFGITDAPVSLGDLSEAAVMESHANLENTYSALSRFEEAGLTNEQKLTREILEDYLKTELSAAELTYYDEVLRPSTGIQAQLPVLYEEYRFYDREDVVDYLELIALTGDYFSQIIDFERRKADAGLFMSDYACNSIISQCGTFTADPDTHYLIETFRNRVERVPGLTDGEREDFCLRNETLVRETILPAYEKLAAALKELLGKGTNDKGLCYFEDGKEYYGYLVYHNTGYSADIPQIQKMVEEQRQKDLNAAAALIAEDPGIWDECSLVALEETDPAATLNVLREAMLKQFPKAPDTQFTVSYIDECMEDYMAPAFYITAPLDDYGNNSIFINASTDSTTMHYFTTLAHEGFPGHLYQTVMSYEAGLAPVRSILNYPGYVEGWATYVEMLSYQYAGLKETVAQLLALNQSALLSLYASTDFGIHYDGWTFEEMAEFWTEFGISDLETLREVYELIVEEPAHYLKYYIGYLGFLDLKEHAKETYAGRYSDVAFHRAVLAIGPAPFNIVKKNLDAYYVAED